MSPVTHFLAGWAVANLAKTRRERLLITLAGVAPDFDGLGIVPELLTRGSSHPLLWFSQYHHLLGHNLGFAIAIFVVGYLVCRRKLMSALLALVSFHLHLLFDLLGSRGPEGYSWPIPYLLPFSNRWQWSWNGQWALNGWQNYSITLALLGATFFLA